MHWPKRKNLRILFSPFPKLLRNKWIQLATNHNSKSNLLHNNLHSKFRSSGNHTRNWQFKISIHRECRKMFTFPHPRRYSISSPSIRESHSSKEGRLRKGLVFRQSSTLSIWPDSTNRIMGSHFVWVKMNTPHSFLSIVHLPPKSSKNQKIFLSQCSHMRMH